MSQFKDYTPSQQAWIHELAKAEIHPDAERLLDLGRSYDPHQLVEESTVEFLTALRDRFNEYARVFNAYSESASRFNEVKIYTIAQSAADFMVFRNQVKLVVSNSAHGVIQILFTKHVRSTVSVDGQEQRSEGAEVSGLGAQEILAQVGPFRDVYWAFHGERVEPEEVARFYFTEFVRATRERSRSRAGNQMLLEEIKSFLKQKGLDL